MRTRAASASAAAATTPSAASAPLRSKWPRARGRGRARPRHASSTCRRGVDEQPWRRRAFAGRRRAAEPLTHRNARDVDLGAGDLLERIDVGARGRAGGDDHACAASARSAAASRASPRAAAAAGPSGSVARTCGPRATAAPASERAAPRGTAGARRGGATRGARSVDVVGRRGGRDRGPRHPSWAPPRRPPRSAPRKSARAREENGSRSGGVLWRARRRVDGHRRQKLDDKPTNRRTDTASLARYRRHSARQ